MAVVKKGGATNMHICLNEIGEHGVYKKITHTALWGHKNSFA
jgi:hypothetical protein